MAPQNLARAAAPAPPERLEASADARLRMLQRQLQNQRARWSTQRGGTGLQAIDDAAPAWLQALTEEALAAGAHWELPAAPAPAVPMLTGTAAEPANRGASLVLLRDGIPQHRFQFGSDRITWEQGDIANGAGRWVLTLPPPAVRRLLTGLQTLPVAPPASAASR